jgi:PPK2 family polyphosphate:nucleotide phosphotransferase
MALGYSAMTDRVSDRWLVPPGGDFKLGKIDPGSTEAAPGGRDETEVESLRLHLELGEYQERLWAEGKRALLVVLQGMDASGKDGTILHVFKGVNPQGVRVATFKVPTPEEQAHDFLWRIHRQAPAAGELAIFNRSHYEDVLVVRVHNYVAKQVWKARYALINSFEQLMVTGGTTIVKICLLISKDEQRRRFEDRLASPGKRWKFNPADLKERELWDDYQKAYQDALRKTSKPHAPWYVIPADHKWYRNWAVSRVLIDTLKKMDPHYPDAADFGSIEIS